MGILACQISSQISVDVTIQIGNWTLRHINKMAKGYPYKVQVIKIAPEITKYCGIYHWSIWSARIQHYILGRKNPKLTAVVYIKKASAPLGEVRMELCEVKFLNINQ